MGFLFQRPSFLGVTGLIAINSSLHHAFQSSLHGLVHWDQKWFSFDIGFSVYFSTVVAWLKDHGPNTKLRCLFLKTLHYSFPLELVCQYKKDTNDLAPAMIGPNKCQS